MSTLRTGLQLMDSKDVATVSNLATDPTVTTDVNSGFKAGDILVNTALGRVWICQSAAVGAAVWALATVPGTGVAPSSGLSQFGASTGTFLSEGNINRQISSAGVQPGGTAVDSVLAVYTLPANAFDAAGRGLTITAQGSFGATGNNKRVKLIFGATTAVVGAAVTGGVAVADTGVVATNGGGWSLQANVFKYGAANSNTQIGLHQQAQVGAAVSALSAPALLTAPENAAILIAVTGNATTVVTDIIQNFLEVNAMN